MSRQAARQAYIRRNTEKAVTLVGGPDDGQRINIFGQRDAVELDVPDPWLDEDDEPVMAVYQKKHGDPDVFEFRHYRNPDGTTTAELDPRPRVRQIAHTWGLRSWDLLNYLRKVDPRIRSAASRVDPATVAELEAKLSANAAPARPPDEGDVADDGRAG
jgi:hypothetical protein